MKHTTSGTARQFLGITSRRVCLNAIIMAASSFKDLLEQFEKELTCSICDEIFQDPRTLPCLHTCCTACIGSWCEAKKKENGLPTCPHCRAYINLPQDKVENLRPSFYLNALLKLLQAMKSKSDEEHPRFKCTNCEEPAMVVAFCFQCNGVICETCVKAHDLLKEVRQRHEVTMLDEFKRENVERYLKNQGVCKERYHETEKLKFYCEDCKVSICQKCAILTHKDHVKSSIEEAAERADKLLENKLEWVTQLIAKDEENVEFSKKNMERIIRNIENAKNEVHRWVNLLIDGIRDHETAMIKALEDKQMEEKIRNQKELNEIEAELKCFYDFHAYAQKIRDRQVACEILESQEALMQRSQTFLEQPSVLSQQPIKRNVTVEYVTNQEVVQSLQEIGRIVECVTDPTDYSISTESLEEIRCGFVNEFEIIYTNCAVCHVTHSDIISITIKDCEANEVKYATHDEGQKLVVSYKVGKPGPYQISATIGGQLIKNSPQTINAFAADREFQPIKVFGKEGKGKGRLSVPWSLALSNTGDIAVVDCDNHCVVLYDADGNFVLQFGKKGQNDGLLSNPCGIAFCQGKILVNDQPDDMGRIQEFDMNGKYQRLLYKSKGFLPRGMCLTDDNHIAVCCDGSDQQKPQIQIFSQDGQFIHKFRTGNKHQIPVFIAYGNEKYFITFYLRSKVCVFSKNGEFLYNFGDLNELIYVCGLSVFGSDMIVVCNCINNCIELFSQEGSYVRSFGTKGSGIGEMVNPNDVVVSAKGHVFVLECGGRRLHVWQ